MKERSLVYSNRSVERSAVSSSSVHMYVSSRRGRKGIKGWRAERSAPTFVPLTIDGLGHGDGQLGGVGVEAAHGGVVDGGGAGGGEGQLVGVPRHAVQRLRQVRRPLQNDLLWG